MRRGEPTELVSGLAWDLTRGVFLVMALPTRLGAFRKVTGSSEGRQSPPSEVPAMGTDAAPTTESTWKIRDAQAAIDPPGETGCL